MTLNQGQETTMAYSLFRWDHTA